MTGRSYIGGLTLVVGLVAAILAGVAAWRTGGPYGERFDVDPRVGRVRNPVTGALDVVALDTDGDLVFDTWNYLQDDRLIRMEFDDDQDGTMDRRRFFKPDGSVDRTESLATGRAQAPGPTPQAPRRQQ